MQCDNYYDSIHRPTHVGPYRRAYAFYPERCATDLRFNVGLYIQCIPTCTSSTQTNFLATFLSATSACNFQEWVSVRTFLAHHQNCYRWHHHHCNAE